MNDINCTLPSSSLLVNVKRFENEFVKLIDNRLGIHVHSHQLKDLEKSIMKACGQLHISPDEYLKSLNTCPENSPLLDSLIQDITIGETYFFRDSNQMTLLHNRILPDIIESRRSAGKKSLRIWSAGCASGEEIYTIAILLKELIPDISTWTLQLLATDINTLSLRKGMEGSYGKWSMRSTSPHFKHKYFSPASDKYTILPEIRELVNFSYLNLNDDTYPSMFNGTNAQDLIICRNVLIYFNTPNIERLMQKLGNSLIEGGFLLLGASDPVYIKNTPLVSTQSPSLFVRRDEQIIFQDIELKTHTHQPVKYQAKKSSAPSTEKRISELLRKAHWQEALDGLSNNKNLNEEFSLHARAMALANSGKLEEAKEVCKQSLQMNPANIQTHFTLAMTLIELGRFDEAESHIRKTLYLDHQYILGHFYLGLLLFRSKQVEAGLKSLRNALKISSTKDPSAYIDDTSRMNYGDLTKILGQEIALYSASESKPLCKQP